MREARDHLADVVNRAAYTKEPVFLTRRGRRVAAVVDAATVERLVELAEDSLDAEAADAARRDGRWRCSDSVGAGQGRSRLGVSGKYAVQLAPAALRERRTHTAFQRSVAALRGMGVTVLYGPGVSVSC
jgi:prevent-host-death family protein